MKPFQETDVSKAILDAYHAKFSRALLSDVIIVGAGPSGLVAAWELARAGWHAVVLEKRLSPGGGIWGGSIGMSEVVVQHEALALLDSAGVRYRSRGALYTADAMELASALCLQALHAGAVLFNLMAAEDICIRAGRAHGVVANRTLLGDTMPIDPVVFGTREIIDATGHEAVLANCLQRRGLIQNNLDRLPGEGAMDAAAGEQFVIHNVAEIFPGLWTSGMSVCATQGGPRMGPIFGGMLLSGKKAAEYVAHALADTQE